MLAADLGLLSGEIYNIAGLYGIRFRQLLLLPAAVGQHQGLSQQRGSNCITIHSESF